ncbi:tyrosyl-tRNA synthetase [Dimargaris xerosporica]|nr:tyrosyl-tRNA synthetase [Dimargaris xerosporica]
MMMRESVKARIHSDQGISFTEFSYQLLQAFDFWYLHHRQDCRVQLGGSDQWGNITAGTELIHKMPVEKVPALCQALGITDTHSQPPSDAKPATKDNGTREAYGLTFKLLTTASGEKFGKSAGNAVWLDETLTSVFDFYQVCLISFSAGNLNRAEVQEVRRAKNAHSA